MNHYAHWKDALEEWQSSFHALWPNFTIKEIAQRGKGWDTGLTPVLIVPDFLDRVQRLRNKCGFPLGVTSWYRSPAYNAKVSSTGTNGPHTTGRAVDLNVSRKNAYIVLKCAFEIGFTGIGVNQKGDGRFIHLDDLEDGRPTCWSYP